MIKYGTIWIYSKKINYVQHIPLFKIKLQLPHAYQYFNYKNAYIHLNKKLQTSNFCICIRNELYILNIWLHHKFKCAVPIKQSVTKILSLFTYKIPFQKIYSLFKIVLLMSIAHTKILQLIFNSSTSHKKIIITIVVIIIMSEHIAQHRLSILVGWLECRFWIQR